MSNDVCKILAKSFVRNIQDIPRESHKAVIEGPATGKILQDFFFKNPILEHPKRAFIQAPLASDCLQISCSVCFGYVRASSLFWTQLGVIDEPLHCQFICAVMVPLPLQLGHVTETGSKCSDALSRLSPSPMSLWLAPPGGIQVIFKKDLHARTS